MEASDFASYGAVSFLHRFGSSLNPHFHFHLCVVDGLFESVDTDQNQGAETLTGGLRFHGATDLTPQLLERLQPIVRTRVLRHFRCHGLLEPHEAEHMLTRDHGGGSSLNASVRVEAPHRAGLGAGALARGLLEPPGGRTAVPPHPCPIRPFTPTLPLNPISKGPLNLLSIGEECRRFKWETRRSMWTTTAS